MSKNALHEYIAHSEDLFTLPRAPPDPFLCCHQPSPRLVLRCPCVPDYFTEKEPWMRSSLTAHFVCASTFPHLGTASGKGSSASNTPFFCIFWTHSEPSRVPLCPGQLLRQHRPTCNGSCCATLRRDDHVMVSDSRTQLVPSTRGGEAVLKPA